MAKVYDFYTRENEDNGRKLQILLQRSDSALLKIFHSHFPKDPEDLFNELAKLRKQIKRLRRDRKFFTGEYYLIFQKENRKKTFSQRFDSPLIVKLLKHFAPDVKKPSNGWDKMPDEDDKSKEAHMVRLVLHRNNVQHGSRFVEPPRFEEIAKSMIESLVALGEDKLSFDDILPPLRYKIQSTVTNFNFREQEIEEIHNAVKKNNKNKLWFVVHALAGTGKSEMARKYAEEYGWYYGGNCVWIKSSSHESLATAFREIAERCELQVKDDKGKLKGIDYIIKKVHEHLQIAPTLYIFDDVVNPISFQNFLPDHPASISLITTQLAEWPESEFKVMELKMFSADESCKFLVDSIKEEHKGSLNEKILEEIFNLLGGQPLALQQFVKATNLLRVNVEKFITSFVEKRGKSLEMDMSLPHSKVSAIAAIKINIERLQNMNNTQLAAKVLETVVYLDITEIPIEVIEMLFSDSDILDITNAIYQLHSRSLVIERDKSLSIHSLVQETVLMKHRDMECSKEFIDKCIDTFEKAYLESLELDGGVLNKSFGEPWFKHLLHLRYTTREDKRDRFVMQKLDVPFVQNFLVG